jgi:hypothetical protein
MEGDRYEGNNFLLPDRVEDWPNVLIDMCFQPYPLPEHLEDSDRNEVLNMSKAVLSNLIPDNQPRQPQDTVAVGDAANDGPGDESGVVRSASARMPKASENRIQLVRTGDAATLGPWRPERVVGRRATR